MVKPCIDCIVSPCCSKRCIEYAIYLYIAGFYKQAGNEVSKSIEKMSYNKAIDHILKVENVYLYMKLLV